MFARMNSNFKSVPNHQKFTDMMPFLKQDNRDLYDYFITNGYELRNYNGTNFVIGNDFELTLELFIELLKNQSNVI